MTSYGACPHCGVIFTDSGRVVRHIDENGYILPAEDLPSPGQLAACGTCRRVSIYTVSGVNRLSEAEALELAADMTMCAMIGRFILQMSAQR